MPDYFIAISENCSSGSQGLTQKINVFHTIIDVVFC